MENEATSGEIELTKRQIDNIYTEVTSIKIKSEDDSRSAAESLAKVKRARKDLKAQKDSIINPAKLTIKNTNALFEPIETKLKDAEELLKEAILEYTVKVQERAAKKAAKIEEKVNNGDIELTDAMGKLSKVQQAETNIRTESGGAQIRESQRKVRIIDASKLPVAYFLRPRVLEALRLEVSEDVLKNKLPCPEGAEVYREKLVAGIAI